MMSSHQAPHAVEKTAGVEPYPEGVPLVEWTGDMDTMPCPPWVAMNPYGRYVFIPLSGRASYVASPNGRQIPIDTDSPDEVG